MIPFPERVNDFAFKIATPNGPGSASANGLIMQAIFRMGIPVSGKNVFPSNIQGLPTWYEIRVNKDAHTARCPDFDLMVALNPATYKKDVAEVRSGGWLSTTRRGRSRRSSSASDVTFLGVPLAQMVQRGLRRRARAHPHEEHRLRRARWRRCSTWTPTSSPSCIKETYGKKPALLASNEKALRARLRLREEALRSARCRSRWPS